MLKNVNDHKLGFDVLGFEEFSSETAQKLVNGLVGLEIHNDGGGMNIEDEVILFTLFPAINSLPDEFIKPAYKKVCLECVFKENACANYKSAKLRYSSNRSHPGVLSKIIKIWNPDYYQTNFSNVSFHHKNRGIQ
jgi:hypothetical protein